MAFKTPPGPAPAASRKLESALNRPQRRRMARSNFALALLAAVVTVVAVLQLLFYFDVAHFNTDVWHSPAANDHRDDRARPGTAATAATAAASGGKYLIGVGKADITGPVVELNLMGYANLSQVGTGLRQRIYSRAFIVGDVDDETSRFVYLVLDTQSGDTAIRNGILDGLAELGDGYAMYGQSNVAVTGTHSHSGPGAWLNYLLPQITSLGFCKESYQAIVDGAVLSIQRAHENLTPGRLSVGQAAIQDTNINRSLWAYLENPEEERARYTDDVDKNMTLLRFRRDSDGKDIGVLTWFAVHGTSLLGNQTLISGDNKGVAAYLFERDMAANGTNAADGFVAGFSQANVGDTTPNIGGAWCEDGSGQQCTLENSTCSGKAAPCHGRGPYWGLNDGGAKSCFEIGRRQYAGAKDLYSSLDSSGTAISGSVKSLHTFVDLDGYSFPLANGSYVKTCSAALGNSFAAGTTDGPGAFDFTQNESSNNPFWNTIGGFLHEPSDEQRACQSPKPVLLDVGATKKPYPWTPNIVDVQLLRVGQFFIIVSPGEATTMSGRRWREAVANEVVSTDLLSSEGSPSPMVVLGAPADSYTHYIATPEEYTVQRYEGASTLYGPYTLPAYINITLIYLPYLSPDSSSTPPSGPSPPDNRNASMSFITGVVYDNPGFRHSFGDVLSDVDTKSAYRAGASTVSAVFVGANPRNDLRLERTFAAVERLADDTVTWVQVMDDADWGLLYEWKRVSTVLGTSRVTVTWEPGPQTPKGEYRLRYYGDAKSVTGKMTPFEGASGTFRVE